MNNEDVLKKQKEKESQIDWNQVQMNVQMLIGMLVKYLKIELETDDYPIVSPMSVYRGMERSPAIYCSDENLMYLDAEVVNSGIALSEEAMHYIRNAAVKENSEEKSLSVVLALSMVDEFFGRLGEFLARELVKDTKLSYLFENDEYRKWSDPELIRTKQEKLRSYDDSLQIMKKIKQRYGTMHTGMMEFVSELHRSVKSLCQSGWNTVLNLKNVVFAIQGIVLLNQKYFYDKLIFAQDKMVYSESGQIINNLMKHTAACLISSRERLEWEGKIEVVLDELADLLVKVRGLGYPEEILEGEKLLRMEIFSEICHINGYVSAELFVERFPDWISMLPAVTIMPSSLIYREFIFCDYVNQWYHKHGLLMSPAAGKKGENNV